LKVYIPKAIEITPNVRIVDLKAQESWEIDVRQENTATIESKNPNLELWYYIPSLEKLSKIKLNTWRIDLKRVSAITIKQNGDNLLIEMFSNITAL
jgi:hypothetical protein